MRIGIPIFILAVITLFSMFLGNSLVSPSESVYIDAEAIVNGGSETFEVAGETFVFGISEYEGMIVIIEVVIAIAFLLGITILGSGLSSETVHIATLCLFYGAVWTILSTLSWSLIQSIEMFGFVIYLVLTIIYVIGIVEKINSD